MLLIVLISCCLYPISLASPASFVVSFKLTPIVGEGVVQPTANEIKDQIVSHFANLPTPVNIHADKIHIQTAPSDRVFFATA